MNEERLVLLACGDVGPIHEPLDAYSVLVRSALRESDIRFAQAERVYSDRGAFQVHSEGHHSRVPPRFASVFTDCGFNLVSLASNHAMDWGEEALLDTIDVFRRRGIRTIGAGRNLREAREPAIFEGRGVRVAFLAYCSILREGYAAGENSPGVAPLRVHTYYEPVEYQPGIPPRVVTIPYEEDLAAMSEDIAAAGKAAHSVVVSLHWGIHFVPRVIADYQPAVARAAFEAGADLILGHHAHVPKAIDVHRGKVCFYSLGNFIMSAPPRRGEKAERFAKRYGVRLDPDYPYLPYGEDAKRSLIARAEIGRDGVSRVSFLPIMIDTQLRPEILKRDDPRFDEAVRYMEWASEDFQHRFVVEGDEVVIVQDERVATERA